MVRVQPARTQSAQTRAPSTQRPQTRPAQTRAGTHSTGTGRPRGRARLGQHAGPRARHRPARRTSRSGRLADRARSSGRPRLRDRPRSRQAAARHVASDAGRQPRPPRTSNLRLVAVLDDLASWAGLTVRLHATAILADRRPRGPVREPLSGACWASSSPAMADGSWDRLKACGNEACRWGFYDTSRARTARWCSMQICGNRKKQQAWRERARDAAAPRVRTARPRAAGRP